MKKLEFIFSKYNFQKRKTPLNLNLVEIEKLIGFKLPKDYCHFVKYYCGFEKFIENEFVHLWDVDKLIVSNIEYGIFENRHLVFAIGGNGSGEFIAIKKNNLDEIKIILSPMISLDAKSDIVIGDSFTDFLKRLDDGREWFD